MQKSQSVASMQLVSTCRRSKKSSDGVHSNLSVNEVMEKGITSKEARKNTANEHHSLLYLILSYEMNTCK